MRTRIANHPTYFELHFQATGEGGLNRALEKASALQYQTWRDSWLAWKASETKDVSPFHSEGMKPNEWRLTDLGVDARCGLGSNNNSTAANCVFDFVLKCGLFGPGHWHLISTARALTTDELRTIAEHLAAGDDISRLRRPAVVGSGELLSIQKIEQPTSAQAVNLVNWAEGADAFTDAFAKLLGPTFERLAHALQSNSTDCDLTQDNLAPQVQASAPTGNAKPKPRLLVTNHPPQATLDGTAYAIKPDAAVFLIALLQANGDWVSPNTHGVRTNRVVKALPAEIRALIETAGARRAHPVQLIKPDLGLIKPHFGLGQANRIIPTLPAPWSIQPTHCGVWSNDRRSA